MLSAFEPNTHSWRDIIVTPFALCSLCTSQDLCSPGYPSFPTGISCLSSSLWKTARTGLHSTSYCSCFSSSWLPSWRNLASSWPHETFTEAPCISSLSSFMISPSSSADTTSAYVMPSLTIVFSSGISFSAHSPSLLYSQTPTFVMSNLTWSQRWVLYHLSPPTSLRVSEFLSWGIGSVPFQLQHSHIPGLTKRTLEITSSTRRLHQTLQSVPAELWLCTLECHWSHRQNQGVDPLFSTLLNLVLLPYSIWPLI